MEQLPWSPCNLVKELLFGHTTYIAGPSHVWVFTIYPVVQKIVVFSTRDAMFLKIKNALERIIFLAEKSQDFYLKDFRLYFISVGTNCNSRKICLPLIHDA